MRLRARAEICANGLDDDCDGVVDDPVCGAMTLDRDLCPAGEPNAALLGLPPGTWVQLSPEPSLRYLAFPRDPERTEAQTEADRVLGLPTYRGNSSPVYGDGCLFYFGGGAASGNAIEVHDIRRNTWTQSYRPNVPPPDDPGYGSGGSTISWVDPEAGETRPYSILNTLRETYDPSRRLLITSATFCADVVRDAAGRFSCAHEDARRHPVRHHRRLGAHGEGAPVRRRDDGRGIRRDVP
jgi:hypothetical protein